MTRERGPEEARADRRRRILTAALKEFTSRGYEAASTNAIAEAAGVAKGLLFHHFGNKEALFVAVFDDVVERTVNAMFEPGRELPSDLFERLHAWAIRKFEVFQQEPEAYEFLTLALTEAPASVKGQLLRRQAALAAKHWPRFMEGIDLSRLRQGLTLSQAVETLSLLAEGMERRMMPQLAALPDRGKSQYAAIRDSLWSHFERLRDGFYTPPSPPAAADRKSDPDT
jgi:AcrR family transcriptional regulator